MNGHENKPEDHKQFAEKSYKEITIWDWLARLLPLSVLAVVTVLHLLKMNGELKLVLEITAITFLIISFIWWFWAIKKIADTIKYMTRTQDRLREVLSEFKLFKKDLKNERNSSDR